MDPLNIFADKLSTFHQQCDERHRAVAQDFKRLEEQMRDFNLTIHGDRGDNGLKSLLVKNIGHTEALAEALKQQSKVMTLLERRLSDASTRYWKLAIVVAAIGGGSGGIISKLL